MEEVSFNYKDKYFLNRLIMHVSGKNELSAYLEPDIDEFIENAKIWDGGKEKVIEMIKICKKHDIIPFWKLIFDQSWSRVELEGIAFSYFHHQQKLPNELAGQISREFAHPINFTRSKWYGIEFNEVDGKEKIKTVQESVKEFIKKGYRVTKLRAELNPRVVTRDHYYDSKEYDATITAKDGKIWYRGKVPKNFDSKQTNLENLPDIEAQSYKEILEKIVRKLDRDIQF